MIALTALIAAGFMITPLAAQHGGRPDQGDRSHVITRDVVLLDNLQILEAVGTGKAQKSVELYPVVAETVTAIHFEAGQKVREGDLLVQLDNQAEKLAVALAKIKLTEAKSLLERYSQAGQEGAVPQSEVDAARADYQAARVALAQARLDRDIRQIRAPYDGVVGLAMVDVGDQVNTSSFIASFDDRSLLYIDFEIPEALAQPLLATTAPQMVTLTTPAWGNEKFTGTIAALDARIHPDRRTLKARARVDNNDDRLRPGMSFRTIWSAAGNRYPAVPEIALQWARDGAFIWLVKNGQAQKTAVELVSRRGGMVLLRGDVTAGDAVVVEGLQRLRPMLIAVANLLIMLAGLSALMGVEVRELPDIDRPVVTVRAIFPGASPETMDQEVTRQIEAAVARVSGVKSIRAASEENNMRLSAEFEPGTDINAVANDVREAVARVQRQLPDNVDDVLVIKADEDASDIISLGVLSNVLPVDRLAERVEKIIAPQLMSIDGVADVQLRGHQPRTLRVLIDPARLATYQIAISEVVEAIRNIHFDVPAGNYESDGQELIVRSLATVTDPDDLKALAIRDTIRLGDIADVFFAPAPAEDFALLNNRPVIGVGIVRQAGSNTIEISTEARKRIAAINERAKDFEVIITSDDAVYISGALREVGVTLVFAGSIVLLMIAIFLGQARATLIPAVTMPVALIGTLAAIWLLGFSINLLTLLALVLATGLIVDDAIVVLENIQRLRAMGHEKMAAAVLGTRQVFFAIVATTISLVSVFLPIAFLPGQTGLLFREFGLVLAIAVVISSFVAVTLCPMMASRLPHLSDPSPALLAVRSRLDRIGSRLSTAYFSSLQKALAQPLKAIAAAMAVALLGLGGFFLLNQELLPQEDRGRLTILMTGPDGASLAYTDNQARKVEAILRPWQEKGVITDVYAIIGRWDKNRAYFSARLADWGDRDISQMDLAADISQKARTIPGAQVRIFRSNSLNLRGSQTGLSIALLGNDYGDLAIAADQLADALKDRIDDVEQTNVEFDTSQPELAFRIDRAKAHDLKVPLDRISQTLRVMVNRFNVTDLNIDDQAVPVFMGPAKGAITDMQDLLNIYVTNEDGAHIPLAAMVTTEEKGVAAELDRFAQRRSIDIDVGLVPGASLGDAMDQTRAIADEILPPGIDIAFRGEAATLDETNYEIALTFVIALLVIFLVLAAQFESLGSATIVILTMPFGLAAAVFALLATGQSLNLYTQIGLVLLIGLMAKNAILLIEFMDQMRDQGLDVPDAVMEAVRVRLRPVTMTALSTVLGALPLVLASGPGAEARSAIGWVIFGGLALSTIFTLYLAPLGYALIAPYMKPRAHAGQELDRQLGDEVIEQPSEPGE
ncbi:nolG [Symbiodinium microadriaticum]|nr:nolG [Symbiodinium microadriaticum]